jgi:GT2 family glycosyltransferase
VTTKLRATVVVPTYRRPDRLPRLFEALEAQVLDRSAFEVLVVDDASGDETPTVLADLVASSPLDVRVITLERNSGPAHARNVGWRSAAADVVAFTDDDCVPSPAWLSSGVRAMEHHPGAGIVQGVTLRPLEPYDYTPRTSYREVLEPSPWFEGNNLFLRRAALDATGGFDEAIRWYGEDTIAGWAVLEAGWERVFDEQAVVRHDVEERPLRWWLWMGWREGILLDVARRHPGLRREGFWRPWAVRPRNVAFATAAAGAALTAATGRARWLVLALPYGALRRPPRGPLPPLAVAAHWVACDTATFAGMSVAAVRTRQLVL